MREIREDFCLRLGERAGNFGYKYVKSRREIYKKSAVFALFFISKAFPEMLLTKASKSASINA